MCSALKQKEDYLSKQNTIALKGILAILVIFHHLSYSAPVFSGSTFIHGIFLNLGFLSVGVFFFISGYGLMTSYKAKGDGYLNGILPKKVIPLYIMCVIISFVYYKLDTDVETIKDIFKLLYKFGEYGYLWYFSSIIVFYCLFFIVYKLKISDKLKHFLITMSILLYCSIISVYFSKQYWKIISLPCFILGCSWSYLKEDFDNFLKKPFNYCAACLISLILFVGMVAFGHFYGSDVFVKMLLSCLFTITVFLITYKISINNIVTRFLGSISLELYAFQYLVIYFWYYIIKISNYWLYILIVLVSLIVIAAIIHPLVKLYMKYSGKVFYKVGEKLHIIKPY